VKCYVGFCGVLVSAHPGWARDIVHMAVRGLTWRKSCITTPLIPPPPPRQLPPCAWPLGVPEASRGASEPRVGRARRQRGRVQRSSADEVPWDHAVDLNTLAARSNQPAPVTATLTTLVL
jgi:hypothetical protein